MPFQKGHKINLGRIFVPKIKIKCGICKKEFEDYLSVNRKFCSKKCANIKQGENMIGISFVRGKHWKVKDTTKYKNRFISEKTKNKISKSKRGSKSHFWKGGVCKENYKERRCAKFSEWRRVVFEYDNYTCWICEIRGSKLHPHHLLKFSDYPQLRFIKNNGLTLCEFCHKTYTEFGKNPRTI